MELISYGSISNDFKIMAQLTKFLNKIKNGDIEQTRVDCYSLDTLNVSIIVKIYHKFKDKGLPNPQDMEVFYPIENYPSHTDDGGTSYFIGLESGNFIIENVSYPIVPFVLYAFEDSKLHNTNFAAIMLK